MATTFFNFSLENSSPPLKQAQRQNGDFCYKISLTVDKQLGIETNNKAVVGLASLGRQPLHRPQIDEDVDQGVLVGNGQLVAQLRPLNAEGHGL